jgi:DNA gyrase subunit A
MEIGTIRQINIDNEMQASYLDYAMSVIVARALPDVRDGLKPVHRRILWAMYDLGLTNDKPYKKSARIVGEVLGKYHPHGDAAVYEAMVRMAQDFSLRYPLVDGQGNFGSIDGDNAAAMRYTEARLAAIANEMLADIEKDTVDWTDNFDGTLKEPSVLPAALPNLVVNGSSGIAVGMATNIPPHNLGEVCDALTYLLDNYQKIEEVSTEDLMKFIQGPDFPTGGIVFRYEHEGSGADAEQVDAIEKAYGSGRGSLVMQARAHIEEMSRNRNRIVVTELPYQTDKSRLLERIAELVRDGRIEGIADLRDESDRTGMRICIELTRTVDARQVLADLYKYTPLQSTFGVSLLALVDGEPRLLGLKKMLVHFIEHRQQVIVRRARHDLQKAKQRAHILEGLLRALDVLDEIIHLIRNSRTADIARQGLMRQFSFTELQAQAILDMQLRRLAALERQRLQDEYKTILKLIKELEELLASPKKVLALIKSNLADLKATYGDARRTQIADRAKAVLTAREHTIERDVWLMLSADGKLGIQNRLAEDLVRKGKASIPASQHPANLGPKFLLPANTRQDLFLFTESGKAVRVQGHQWPDLPGTALADLAGIKEPVAAMLACDCPEGDEAVSGYILFGTAQGKVKRINLVDLLAQAHASPQVIGLDEGDRLVWAAASQGGGEVLMCSAAGQAIRFQEDDVRAMGLPAGGIGGMKLREGDQVVAGFWLPKAVGTADAGPAPVKAPKGKATEAKPSVAIVTAGGFVKQVLVDDFPAQGRYGVGVMATSLTSRMGEVAGAAILTPAGFLVCLAAGNKAQVLAASSIPVMARAAQGKNLFPKDLRITRVFGVEPSEPTSNGGGGGNGSGPADGGAPPERRANPPAAAGPGVASNGKRAGGKSTGNGVKAQAPANTTRKSRAGEAAPARGKKTAAEPASVPESAGPDRTNATTAPGESEPVTGHGPAETANSTGKAASKRTTAVTTPEAVIQPAGRPAPAEPETAIRKSESKRVAATVTTPPAAEPQAQAAPVASQPPAKTTAKSAAGRVAPSASTSTQVKDAPQPPAKSTGKAASRAQTPGTGGTTAPARPPAKAAKPAGRPDEGAAAEPRAISPPGAAASTGSSQPIEVARTSTKVTYDREALRSAVNFGDTQLATRRKSPAQSAGAEQLPLVPSEPPASNAAPGKPAAAAKKPAAPAAPAARSKAAGKATNTPPTPTTPPAAPIPRARHSAADGPMTWPKVPAGEDEGEELMPPPPKSRPRRT